MLSSSTRVRSSPASSAAAWVALATSMFLRYTCRCCLSMCARGSGSSAIIAAPGPGARTGPWRESVGARSALFRTGRPGAPRTRRRIDLASPATHEVPPHHDRLVKRLATQQQCPGGLHARRAGARRGLDRGSRAFRAVAVCRARRPLPPGQRPRTRSPDAAGRWWVGAGRGPRRPVVCHVGRGWSVRRSRRPAP
jgi:hypothetical protein